MKRGLFGLIVILCVLCAVLLTACAWSAAPDAEGQSAEPTEKPTPVPTEEPIITVAPVITEAPTETPTPEPTPEPTPVFVTIGAVGDIMVPSGIVADVRTEEGAYDFTTLFASVRELFESVDLMCGNLEAPIAGAQAGYSAPRNGEQGLYTFNSPDSLLDTLKEDGMDVLTTANNHCMDRGKKGLFRTVETVRAAGFLQTGTYLDEADREKPLIAEVNGMRLGIVASTRLLNAASKDFSRGEAHTCISYLTDSGNLSEDVLKDIERVKAAGAEYVIVFAHWDYEDDNPVAAITKSLAKQLFEAGADCIIGSHPHRVKSAEYITYDRGDGERRGLVLYSLGNFTANQVNCMTGLFAKITLTRDLQTGQITLCDAACIPTLIMKRDIEGVPRFTVVPTYADPERITGLSEPLNEKEIDALGKARAAALLKLGRVDGLRILDEEP